MRVDQWVPAAHRGDAIGDESLRIRDLLREAGHEAEVFAIHVDDDVAHEVRVFESRPTLSRDDVVILHFALPSPLTREFAGTLARKLLVYHNITPHEFFVGYDDELVRICVEGRRQLAELAPVVDMAVGDSGFNRRELDALGYRRTGVVPILLDFERFRSGTSNDVLLEMLDDDRANFLFVGRVVPNKKFEDLLRFAFFFKKYVSENFRLILVGKAGRMEAYQQTLQALADRWGLRPAEVWFTGHVDWDELLAIYDATDVFVSMSEHEGFSVPLVECMLKRVPIMAYAAGAVPDTLGGAGMLFHEKNYEELAEMGYLLASDAELSGKILESQDRRLAEFDPNRVGPKLLSFVEEVLS